MLTHEHNLKCRPVLWLVCLMLCLSLTPALVTLAAPKPKPPPEPPEPPAGPLYRIVDVPEGTKSGEASSRIFSSISDGGVIFDNAGLDIYIDRPLDPFMAIPTLGADGKVVYEAVLLEMPADAAYGEVLCISASGVMGGRIGWRVQDAQGAVAVLWQPVYWDAEGALNAIEGMPPDVVCVILAINAAGDMMLMRYGPNGPIYARNYLVEFNDEGTEITDLGLVPWSLHAMTDTAAVGTSYSLDSSRPPEASLFPGFVGSEEGRISLALNTFVRSEARDINADGVIVGWAQVTRDSKPGTQTWDTRAYKWTVDDTGAVVATDLGDLAGIADGRYYANSINNAGQIVGCLAYADKNRKSRAKGFVYENGHMYDLECQVVDPPAGLDGMEAYGINEAGWIYGQYRTGSGTWRFCVLVRVN